MCGGISSERKKKIENTKGDFLAIGGSAFVRKGERLFPFIGALGLLREEGRELQHEKSGVLVHRIKLIKS